MQVIGATNVQNGTLAPRSGLGKDTRCTRELKGRGTTPLSSLYCILQDVGASVTAQHRLSLTHVSKGAAAVENLHNIPCRDSKETAWGRAAGWREMTTDKSQRVDQDS